jgi:hypothetical protein
MRQAIILIIFLLLPQICLGAGNGSVVIKLNDGSNVATSGLNTLEIWLANDDLLQGMSLGLIIDWEYSSGFMWNMLYGSHAPVHEHPAADGVWDMTGLVVDHDFNSIGPDRILIGGNSIMEGLPGGSSRLCYSLTFWIDAPPGTIGQGISVRPYFYSPAGTWTFTDYISHSYQPEFCGYPVYDAVPDHPPVYFDIEIPQISCGDVNCDGTSNVSDAVWIINYVFVGGNPPCDTDGDGEPDC